MAHCALDMHTPRPPGEVDVTATDTDQRTMPPPPKEVFTSHAVNFVALLSTWAIVFGVLVLYAIHPAY